MKIKSEPCPFFAGFDFAGYRCADGSIEAVLDRSVKLPDWPKEVTICGSTYTLERIEPGKNGFENAIYV